MTKEIIISGIRTEKTVNVVSYSYNTWGKLISITGNRQAPWEKIILIDTEDIYMTQKPGFIIFRADIITLNGVGL